MWTPNNNFYGYPMMSTPVNPENTIEQNYKFWKKLRKDAKKEFETEVNEKKKKEDDKKKGSSSSPVDKTTWLIMLATASPLVMFYMFVYFMKDILMLLQHVPVTK
jgi:hypothetical protein